MTTELQDSLIQELVTRLGDKEFYSVSELVTIGFFGSKPGARLALRQGALTFIRISPRRIAIPKQALIAFLRDNLEENICLK